MSASFPPIAVVGVSALFPGSLDKGGFWRDILAGKDLISDVPPNHWLIEDYYDPDPSVPDKTYAKRGAFLDKVVFDPMTWGIPPSLLPQTDTAQLLALIVARKVLDDASQNQFDTMDKNRISVILGATGGQTLMGEMVSRLQRPVWVKALREAGLPESRVTEICDAIAGNYADWKEGTFPGLLGNVIAGRIANRLDLGGTNCVTDAACASSLSAISMAVNELNTGQSDVVITGGVDTMNDIFMFMCFSKTPALSKSGDCRPFSDQADGTMLGEGIGMVALKRLEDAERDGDRIYAVMRGIGSSSDGRSKSVYAPVSEGQAKALARAYGGAGYGPETVELVEAHGTGTKAGDAAEFGGLKLVFDTEKSAQRQWCALGSVKAQIGHTKAAAGAAGLFKVVMALHHKVLPPTPKIDRPNPNLGLEDSAFYLNTEARPWVRDAAHPRRAGVSSFGFGGSNFHLTCEEYRGSGARAARLRQVPNEMVVFAGDSPAALRDQIQKVRAQAEPAGALTFLAHQSQQAAGQGAYRAAVLAADEQQLIAKLDTLAAHLGKGTDDALHTPDGVHFEKHEQAPQTAFVFPGQGSQYLHMGGDVAMAFESALSAWDDAAAIQLNGELPIHRAVFPVPVFEDAARKEQSAVLTRTEVTQPALAVSSLALLRVLEQLGVKADAAAGHSFGEVAALHAAGVFDTETYLAVAVERGRLMAEAAVKPGSMLAVSTTRETLEPLVKEAGLDVVLANHNAPEQVVLAGDTTAVETAKAFLKEKGLRCKLLNVGTAFHSPIVADSAEPFKQFLADKVAGEAAFPVYSNSYASAYPTEKEAVAQTLGEQIAMPVRFVEQIEAMYDAGIRVFLEVGPGSVLTGLIGRILGDRPHLAVPMDRKGRNGLLSLHAAAARLFTAGVSLDLSALWQDQDVPQDPATKVQPKVSFDITGSNHGKPYPPEGGTAALPKPNPEVKAAPAKTSLPQTAPQPVQSGPAVSVAATRQPAAPVAKPAPATSVRQPAVPAPMQRAQPRAAAPGMQPKPVEAKAVMTNKNTSKPAQNKPVSKPRGAMNAWLAAYSEVQQQTAKAHEMYQQTTAQAHLTYLKTAEQALQQLAQLAGGTVAAPAKTGLVLDTPLATSAPVPPAQVPAVSVAASAAPVPVAKPAAPAPVAKSVTPAPVAKPATSAPVAKPAAPAPAAKASSGPSAAALLLKVVADKTGYPEEMLQMGMDLEADLGVDSIKRVEILSAMREAEPNLPEVDPAEMASLQTLQQIAEYLGDQTPPADASGAASGAIPVASAAPAASTGTSAPALLEQLLTVIADKTGYPQEMLAGTMDLEADLGVDSIKRVEILSAVREASPDLPEINPAEMAELKTIDDIAGYLGQFSTAAPALTAPAAAVAAPAGNIATLLRTVVADKTGYPVEMLDLGMDLEADLGVDSIKRVEILSAVREAEPNLPEIDPSEMAELRTLQDIVSYLEKQFGGAAPVSAPTATVAAVPAVGRLSELLLNVIADKTGYPSDMLNMDMDLEADLGVDSIKRVEILSAMREAEPNLPEIDPSEMAELRTLAQIRDYMANAGVTAAPIAAVAAPAAPAAPAASVNSEALLLRVIADKTGYPADMLNLDMDLEADLGVDSIKRVEILSAMRDENPEMPEVDPAEMAELRTLAQICQYMDGQAAPAPAPNPAPVAPVAQAPAAAPAVKAEVKRYALAAVPTPAGGLAMAAFGRSRKIAVTRDDRGVSEALVVQLAERGIHGEVVNAIPADADGIILLEGLNDFETVETAASVNELAFNHVKAASANLDAGAFLVTVQDSGGDFGLSGRAGDRAWSAGLTGLLKTAAIEWPAIDAKAIDLERAERTPKELAAALIDELTLGGPELEVGLCADGTRLTLQSRDEAVLPAEMKLNESSVIVATGGARGVTAATLIELAEATQAKFVLLGRTPLEDEPEAAAGIRGEADLKKALLRDAKSRGEAVTPAQLNRRVQRILANREIQRTQSEIRIAGGSVQYLAVNVLDADALNAALDGVRASWGPITGIVHAAGVLADKLIKDKTSEQFQRVFRTKVEGLQRLLAATAQDPLEMIVMFSSVAGRCGNQGQCDYAMANEVLNKVAGAERARRGILVKSFNWGPWESGMVNDALKARFEAAGIPIIGLQQGAQMMVDELKQAQPDQVEITVGGEPKVAASLGGGAEREARMEVAVDAQSYPFLNDHSIRGVPVAPVVMVVEWFTRAAKAYRPHQALAAIRDIQVLRGIQLDRYSNGGNRYCVHCRPAADGTSLELALHGDNDQLHYRAVAEFGSEQSQPAKLPEGKKLEQWTAPIYDGDVLFHGPEFQVIRSLNGVSEEGIEGELEGTHARGWKGGWQTDVAAFDGGLQLALLWGKHKLGAATLPTSVGSLKTYAAELPQGPMKASLECRAVGGTKTISNIVFHDGKHVLAEMRDVETHLVPS
ncbi:type I polyketide synthase [Acanthopleuribacter pedis]|uniref:SDR family NAD(P)-dependent oxidoreductase n=1 Tax=Acanthopleuribacter pedis TaxID=442870 RepID=A0A8J7Q4M4_9BACT|nr:type I polyketide synthase [Acanthopleuribacter pedis]MBO1319020.1 SDR family NAD(P)-dependent oxidoreductase [Acanthopleuribacter pedis]